MIIIHKASAGSGKTYQLSKQYLQLLLGVRPDPEKDYWILNPALLTSRPSLAHRNILAVTFTNKATEEMKNRIVGYLSSLGTVEHPADHEFADSLMEKLHCSFPDLKRAARHATVSLLADYSFFNVSTIDSFFQSILRAFARELDIQGDYNIQIDADDAVRDAFELMLDSLNTPDLRKATPLERRVVRWLENFVKQKTDNAASDTKRDPSAALRFSPFARNRGVYNGLIKTVKDIFNEEFKTHQAAFRAYLESPERLTRLQERLAVLRQGYATAIREAGNAFAADLEAQGMTKALNRYFAGAVEKFNDGTKTDMLNNAAYFQAFLNGPEHYHLMFNKPYKQGEPLPQQTIRTISTYYHALVENLERLQTVDMMCERIPDMEFMGLMMKYLDRVRENDNMLILDDTSAHISRILGNSYVPFVYEQMGNRYRHFLIDEFQDTSRMQWDNLLPLIRNSHDDRDDSLMIGDVKQAIYRWRNSDSTILEHDLENVDFKDPSERTVHGTSPEENTNWRSAHGIVRFNNAVLPRLASLVLDTENPAGYCGGEIIQRPAPKKTAMWPARLRLVPYTGVEKGEDPAYDPEAPLLERGVAPDTLSRNREVVSQILDQHKRGYAWKDIAVLVRRNAELPAILLELQKHGVPVQSAESLYLRNATSVRMLLGILRMMATTADPVRNAPGKGNHTHSSIPLSIFQSRYEYFLNTSPGATPQQAMDMALDVNNKAMDTDLRQAVDGILDMHPATLAATVEAVIARGLIPPSVVQEERDFLAAFSDVVMDFAEQHTNDLNTFLKWWDVHQKKFTVTPPAEMDAVRLMTIHKAKGLEFDCVHLAEFNWDNVSPDEKKWVAPVCSTGGNLDLNLPELEPELIPPLLLVNLRTARKNTPGTPFASYIRELESFMRHDSMNMAYVALTRPRKELTIYIDRQTDRNGLDSDNISANIVRVIQELSGKPGTELAAEIPPEAFNPETWAMDLDLPAGNPGLTLTATEKPVTAAPEDDYTSTNYLSSLRADMKQFITVVSLDTGVEQDTGDDTDNAEEHAVPTDFEAATLRGSHLHDLLAGVAEATSIHDALDAYLEAHPDINADELRNDVNRIEQQITCGEAARWFEPGLKVSTEIPFFKPSDNPLDRFRDGQMLRIDRMVEYPDGHVDIVDYKFTTSQRTEHERQVQEYVREVRKIFKHNNINGYLWYVDINKIKPVTV